MNPPTSQLIESGRAKSLAFTTLKTLVFRVFIIVTLTKLHVSEKRLH